MTEITTLSQFLKTANTQFQVYDLGRRVQHIDMMTFHQIEALQTPYPSPVQGHAQFAIVFWDASQQHYIWFIKLALDEQGLFSPAPRLQFIKMIIEALGRDPTQPLTEQQQEQLANHPFNFKPPQEKLAVFNALVRKQLGEKASAQYEFAYQYISGQYPQEQWQNMGMQGIADVCVRADQLDHQQQINACFERAAPEVRIAMCQCLEHLTLDDSLADIIFEQCLSAAAEQQTYLLRALASQPLRSQKAIAYLDATVGLTADTLIAIAARNWSALNDEHTLKLYLEALAKQEQHFFNQVFADMVAIPLIRTQLLAQLRDPNRSTALSAAIGGLFKAMKA